MTNELLDLYRRWLEAQILPDTRKTHYGLSELLFSKEFIWLVPHDDNRIYDALELRHEYQDETGLDIPEWPCSVLEVMIALSRRLEFMAGGDAKTWAWRLVKNLELDKYADFLSPRRAEHVDAILEGMIYRTYHMDGQGGLFPLAWPQADQRKIELWYQMCAYVEEIHQH